MAALVDRGGISAASTGASTVTSSVVRTRSFSALAVSSHATVACTLVRDRASTAGAAGFATVTVTVRGVRIYTLPFDVPAATASTMTGRASVAIFDHAQPEADVADAPTLPGSFDRPEPILR